MQVQKKDNKAGRETKTSFSWYRKKKTKKTNAVVVVHFGLCWALPLLLQGQMIILFHWTLGSARLAGHCQLTRNWTLKLEKCPTPLRVRLGGPQVSSSSSVTNFLLSLEQGGMNFTRIGSYARVCVCVTLTTNSIQFATTTWPKTSHRRGWFHSSTFSLSALCSHKNKNKSLNKYKKNKKKERQVVAGLWIVYVISTRCWAGHHQQMTSSQSPSSSNQATTRHTAATDVWKVAR